MVRSDARKCLYQTAISAGLIAASFAASQLAATTGPGLWWGFFSIATGGVGLATAIVTLIQWGESP